MLRIVRFRDLEPTWTTKQAKEPGFLRWLVTWVGGPVGHINTSPTTAIPSAKVAVGMTVLEPGHSCPAEALLISRTYVVVGGEAITDPGSGNTILGRFDGLHVPAGMRVAIRNNGPDPLQMLWVDTSPFPAG